MYSSRPSKILIIDDDVELVTLLVDYFTLEGFEATPAHTGLEGLQALQAKEFDLIVLDVMMPGISGTETLQRIREKWRTPVLMLTARGDPVAARRATTPAAGRWCSVRCRLTSHSAAPFTTAP